MEHDAPLDSRDAEGYTPLLTACGLGWADVAKAMLARGADPNIRTKAGLTAVDLAIAANSPETVSLHVSKGAN